MTFKLALLLRNRQIYLDLYLLIVKALYSGYIYFNSYTVLYLTQSGRVGTTLFMANIRVVIAIKSHVRVACSQI